MISICLHNKEFRTLALLVPHYCFVKFFLIRMFLSLNYETLPFAEKAEQRYCKLRYSLNHCQPMCPRS